MDADAGPSDGWLSVYSCANGKLVQSRVDGNDSSNASRLLRAGHAVWTNGRLDENIIDAMAEGRGIWSAAPLTTLARITGAPIPAEILTAIALKETGLNGRFWPWSIHWSGRSYRLPSRQQAVAAAQYLLAQGITNFDVSVMQVNWRWHSGKFASIQAAFDPVANIQVAGQILNEHFLATGNWRSAIARYHSRTPALHQPYLADVLGHLRRIQTSTVEPPEKHLC